VELRVEYLDPFYDSFLLLDDRPETFHALVVLLDDTVHAAETVPLVGDTDMRVMVTDPEGDLVLLRVYFFIEDGAIQIMKVQHYRADEP